MALSRSASGVSLWGTEGGGRLSAGGPASWDKARLQLYAVPASPMVAELGLLVDAGGQGWLDVVGLLCEDVHGMGARLHRSVLAGSAGVVRGTLGQQDVTG